MSVERQLLFIQGGGKGAHDQWDNRLVDSLQRELGNGYQIHYPRMPHEESPSYASWQKPLEQAIQGLPDDSVVVAHSIGATLLVQWLSEQAPTPRLAGVYLISAPFVGTGGWPNPEFEFPAKLSLQLAEGVPLHLFHGLKDETAPPSHLALYARAIPRAHSHRLPERDHQLNDDLSEVAAQILRGS